MKRVSIKTLSDSSIHIKEEPNGDHVLLSVDEVKAFTRIVGRSSPASIKDVQIVDKVFKELDK